MLHKEAIMLDDQQVSGSPVLVTTHLNKMSQSVFPESYYRFLAIRRGNIR